VAALLKARNIFALYNTGILDSNPTEGMNACVFFLCFCYPVQVASLGRADPLSKDFYQHSERGMDSV
jgi:hypothetical protein